jgi:hypothetical protein
MSLPPEFVAKYKPIAQGWFMETWVHQMTPDELRAVIGWYVQQVKAMRKEHDADLDKILGPVKR